MLAVTAAGAEHYYQRDGLNAYTIPELTLPIERMANYCKAYFYPKVFVVYRAKPVENGGINAEELAQKKAEYRAQVLDFMQQA